ncbi:MAG: response regulator [Methylococcales bacterium]|nr:response regulator [Methylococcales bacterium]
MNIIIVEDEIPAFQRLHRMLQKEVPGLNLLAHLDTVEDTVDWLENNPSPELIFLDIQLADGLSTEIFKQTEVKTPVIFTTAYDQYAV